jgi:hypothetical protein
MRKNGKTPADANLKNAARLAGKIRVKTRLPKVFRQKDNDKIR